jgi:hypothetical protein
MDETLHRARSRPVEGRPLASARNLQAAASPFRSIESDENNERTQWINKPRRVAPGVRERYGEGGGGQGACFCKGSASGGIRLPIIAKSSGAMKEQWISNARRVVAGAGTPASAERGRSRAGRLLLQGICKWRHPAADHCKKIGGNKRAMDQQCARRVVAGVGTPASGERAGGRPRACSCKESASVGVRPPGIAKHVETIKEQWISNPRRVAAGVGMPARTLPGAGRSRAGRLLLQGICKRRRPPQPDRCHKSATRMHRMTPMPRRTPDRPRPPACATPVASGPPAPPPQETPR